MLYQINACPGVVATLPCSPVQTASQAGLPQGLRYTYWRDFDPRISVAWRPFGNAKTVLRAGFGVYTAPQLGGVPYQMTGLASTPSLFYVNGLDANGKPLFPLPSVAFGNGGLTPAIVGAYEYYVAQQIHYRPAVNSMERHAGTPVLRKLECEGPLSSRGTCPALMD